MSKLSKEQWLLIAGFLAAMSGTISGYDHWSDLGKPVVFGSFLLQLSIMLRGLFTQTTEEKTQ